MACDHGPLAGVRIVEIAGIGPAPFCCMMLADQGAEVIRVNRLTPGALDLGDSRRDILNRSRRTIGIDLKHPQGVALIHRLSRRADGLVEGFRPGVMERLGLGPDVLLETNPTLVYGRMTGWGQTGPLANSAGHDINYIALSGALAAIGEPGGAPVPPLNLVGDFGGGMMMAFGMLAAILQARETGKGQVVDCAMTEGSALLMAMIYSLRGQGRWQDTRGVNMLDGGAHFYGVYETSDGGHMAVGPVEPQFYRLFIDLLGLAEDARFVAQNDPTRWAALRAELAQVFRTRTRAEWAAVFEGTDACVAPVLTMHEAPEHSHNAARGSFVELEGMIQPAPGPRYSATPNPAPTLPADDTDALLAEAELTDADVSRLREQGVIA